MSGEVIEILYFEAQSWAPVGIIPYDFMLDSMPVVSLKITSYGLHYVFN